MSRPRVAAVTGAARGMGFACASRLAGSGTSVVLLDVNGSDVEEAAARIARDGGEAVGLQLDVTDEAAVDDAFARIRRSHGPPAILLNAAGILRRTRFTEITLGEWTRVVDVSLKGTFLCSRACVPAMVDAGWGRIVNFSSTAGKSVSTLGGAHYTAAKAAVLGLTRAIAKEVAGAGVCVNAVCPGLIETEMVHEFCDEAALESYARSFPIPRLGSAAEVAAVVAFLCSDEAAYITGAALDVNGGDLMV